jgi:hypothetical protein
MYVDLPVNCILRTSLLSDREVNYDNVEGHAGKHIVYSIHIALY